MLTRRALRGPSVGLWCATLLGAISCHSAEKSSVRTPEYKPAPPDVESPPSFPEEADLEVLVAWALAHHPEIRSAYDLWEASILAIQGAEAFPDPGLSYRYFQEEVETRVGPQEQAFSLSQQIPWFGKIQLKGDAARASANAALARYEATRISIASQVKEAYWDYAYLEQAVAIVSRNRDLARYLESVARARYAVGGTDQPDVLRAQVALGQIEDRLQTLKERRRPVLARLNEILARPSDAELPAPLPPPRGTLSENRESLIERLETSNPSLEMARSEVERFRHQIDLARKGYYPDLTVGLDYIQTGPARMDGVSGSGDDPLAVSLSLNLPIHRGTYRAAVREAQSRHRAALATLQDRHRDLVTELVDHFFQFQDAERKIDLYRENLIPKARQSLSAVETAFKADKKTFLDLVFAQQTLLDFELAHARALADFAKQHAALERILGDTIPLEPTSSNTEGPIQ